MDEDPVTYCKYRQGLKDIYDRIRRNVDKQTPAVHWLAGPPGCGKTRLAGANNPDVWISSVLPWFDGYTGQQVAILDDYRSGDLPFNRLLRVLDRYRLDCPVKGGFTYWNPKVIYITCPRVPQMEFVRHGKDAQGNADNEVFEDVGQVTRRCTTIREWSTTHECWIWHKGTAADVQEE